MVDEIRARSGWRVLSGNPADYGAEGAQILAIYDNFLRFAVSVLLPRNLVFLLEILSKKKEMTGAENRLLGLRHFLSHFYLKVSIEATPNAYRGYCVTMRTVQDLK
ncbi:hypothetical protein ACNU59_002792 [Escherichia coli]